MQRTTIDISWISLWRILAFLILTVIMFLGRSILLGLFLAIVISSGLEFIVNFLERRKIPRSIGVILIFLLSALVLITIVYTIIPLVIVDMNTVFSYLDEAGRSGWLDKVFSLPTSESFNSLLARLSGSFFSGNASPFQALAGVVGGFALAISVVVSSFYLSLSRDGVERFIRAVFPKSSEETALRIYHRSTHRVGQWFRAQLLLSLVMGVLMLIALLLLDVKYAVLLALITAILEVVPFIGPIIAGSLAVIAAFLTSPAAALYTLVIALALHQLENHVLVPVLVGKNIGLHPVIVIVALLIGLEVGGILGMVIAVPLAVVIQEVIEEWGGRKQGEETLEDNALPELV